MSLIRDVPSDRIDGGAKSGANLFHSFQEFNIGEGRGAYFTNAIGIENILSRVTGGNVSNILGKLGVLGNANLFLINPNGIIFGPNASLDIGGAFVGSTASAVNFADGTHFSATAPSTTPLLTVSVPLGLQYGGNAGSVQVQGSALQVDTGQTLALVGGNVSVDGGRLQAAGGRVELGGLAQAGWVGLNVDSNQLSLSFTDGATAQTSAPRADVSLSNAASVRVAASGGGSIAVNARNLEVLGGSSLIAGVGEGLGSSGIEAGDVSLSATEAIAIGQSSSIQNTVNQNAIGNSGDIDILTGSLSITDGAFLSASTFGRGNAGRVFVQATDSVSLAGSGTTIFSTVESGAEGNGGDILINAGSLSVNEGAQLLTIVREQSAIRRGNAGNIIIAVRNDVTFAGFSEVNGSRFPSQAASSVGLGAVGQGGNINIQAGSLSLNNGAQLVTSTFGHGDAGNISLRVNNSVSLTNDSQIRGVVQPGGVGNASNIDIRARSLSLTNGSQVGAVVSRQQGGRPGGQGRGGNILVNASDSVTLSGVSSSFGFSSGLLALTERGALGSAGDINVSTGNFRVADGAIVAASTFNSGDGRNITINAQTFEAVNGGQVLTNNRSSGNAGNIRLNVTDSVMLSGSDPNFAARQAQIAQRLQFSGETDQVSDVVANEGAASGLFANTASGSTGNGGSIFIDPIQLTITDGAGVSVDSQGQGSAGNLEIIAGSVILDRGAFLSATTASGENGNITLRSQDLLLLRRNSQISTAAGGTGNGGNIDIDAAFIVALPSEDSNIIADAIEGRGGNINITAQGIFGIQPGEQQTSQSDITASSQLGIEGEVEINTPDVDPNQGLVTLPAQLVDASGLIATGCAAVGENKFIVTGRGGLPPNPGDTLSGEALLVNWATLDPEVENRSGAAETATNSTRERAPTQIVEAQGWVFGPKGEVILTASAPTVTPHSAWLPTVDCSN